jgi:hypothetical protein
MPTPDKPVFANKKQKRKGFRKRNSKRIYFKRKFAMKVGGPLPPPEPGYKRLKLSRWVWKPIESQKIPEKPTKSVKGPTGRTELHNTRSTELDDICTTELDAPQKVEPKKEVEKEVDKSETYAHFFSSYFSPAVSKKPAKEKKPTKPETTGQITPAQPGTPEKPEKTISLPAGKVTAPDKRDSVASVPKQAAPDTEKERATPVAEIDGGEGNTATEIGSSVDPTKNDVLE